MNDKLFNEINKMNAGYPCLRIIQNYKDLKDYLNYIEKVYILDKLNVNTIEELKNDVHKTLENYLKSKNNN